MTQKVLDKGPVSYTHLCDKELVESLFAKYDFDYVINFAAESHVDRSIKNPEIFVQSHVMGTVNLLQRAKEAWYDADAKTWNCLLYTSRCV